MDKRIAPREAALRELMESRLDGQVKVITGIRRCGKSFLFRRLFRDRLLEEGIPGGNIVEVDLDDASNKALRDPILLDAHVRKLVRRRSKHPYFVFVDEIQRCRKVLPDGVDLSRVAPGEREDAYVTFYDVLNGWRNLPNVDVYVTGSNSKTLSSDIATQFRDRGRQIRLAPLRFSEYLAVSGLADKGEALDRYLTWGGMPLAVFAAGDAARAKYLQGLFSEVYLNDIRERHAIRDDAVLSALLDVLSSSVGSLVNPHKIGDTMNSLLKLHPSDHTLKNYLDWLEDAFLFAKARRFDVKGRHYIDSPSKWYATDLGLRNARLNFRDTDRSHPLENAVFNELVARGCNVDVGVVPIASRTDGRQSVRQHEIDFVVNRGNDKIYIQCALRMDTDEKRNRELFPLRKSGDFFRKIIVTGGHDAPFADRDGILHVGVIPFLLDESILTAP